MKTYFLALSILFLGSQSMPVLAQPTNASLNKDEIYTLEIPAVDFDSTPGNFQKVIFQSQDSELTWTLISAYIGEEMNLIHSAELVKTSEIPVQVFVKVSGAIATCLKVGQHAIMQTGNSFDIRLYYDPESIPPQGVACADHVISFVKVIPLQVYGLDAGTYNYSVNGKLSGNFVLQADNILP